MKREAALRSGSMEREHDLDAGRISEHREHLDGQLDHCWIRRIRRQGRVAVHPVPPIG